jgi:pilus assembly protein CpaE
MRTLVVNHSLIDPLTHQLRDLLQARVDPQGPTLCRFDDAERQLAQMQPDITVVILSHQPERGLELLGRLRRQMAGSLLAVGQAADSKLILRALNQGADLFLDEAELAESLEAALARLQRREEPAAPAGRVVAVLASSGGCGASTLAVNVAAVLAKDHKRCALVDLKPGRGDLAALLDLKPAFTLADLCLNVSRLDRAMFEKLLTPHSCGIQLLASPQVFEGMRVVTAQGTGQALNMARKLFPYVVVDLEDCFHEEQLLTLNQAAAILLVIRLDFTSLRNARRVLEHLQEQGIPDNRLRLVANRYGQPNELPAGEAEKALGLKVAYYIPEDAKTINGANNTGIPAVIKAPSARVSQSLSQMARVILERRRHEPAEEVKLLIS